MMGKKMEDRFRRITYRYIGSINDFISPVYIPIVKDNIYHRKRNFLFSIFTNEERRIGK